MNYQVEGIFNIVQKILRFYLPHSAGVNDHEVYWLVGKTIHIVIPIRKLIINRRVNLKP